VVSFAGSFITAAFGIGGGIAFLADCAVLLPPAAIIPIHGVVQLGSNSVRALMFTHISPKYPILRDHSPTGSINRSVVNSGILPYQHLLVPHLNNNFR
jgi:hypothetical protein